VTPRGTSVASRVRPARIERVEFDPAACRLIADATRDVLDVAYGTGPGLRLDVRPARSLAGTLTVRGDGGGLCVESPAMPYAVAAVLLALRDTTGVRPRCRFPWPRHHRLTMVLGLTGPAAAVREVLRRSEPDPRRRPAVYVSD
jgi:hypothetical protein